MAKPTTSRHSLKLDNKLPQDSVSATSQQLALRLEASSGARLNRKVNSQVACSEPSPLVDCSAVLLEPQVTLERPPRASRRLEVVFSEQPPSLRSRQDSRPVAYSVALAPALLERPRPVVSSVNRLKLVLPEAGCSATLRQGRPRDSVNLLLNLVVVSSVRTTNKAEEDYLVISTRLSKGNRISKARPVVYSAPSQTLEALACSASLLPTRV